MLREDGDESIHSCLCNGPLSSAAVATNPDMRIKKQGFCLGVIGQEMVLYFLEKILSLREISNSYNEFKFDGLVRVSNCYCGNICQFTVFMVWYSRE